jgi:hypothetical protein
MEFLKYASIPVAILIVWLGRRSHREFAIGSSVLLLIAIVLSVYRPNVITEYRGPLWASGYATWAIAFSTLWCIALVATWRNFNKPGVGALFTALIVSFLAAGMGLWVA